MRTERFDHRGAPDLVFVGAVLVLATLANGLAIDPAFDRLRQFDYGGDDTLLQFLRDATLRSHDDPSLRELLLNRYSELLQSDAPSGAKDFICRQLALIGDETCVEALGKLLSDETMSHMARYALSRIHSTEVDRALVAGLDETTGRTQLGIINTLGNRRSPLAIGKLSQLLQSDEPDVASESAVALGRIGGELPGTILKNALANSSGAVRPAVARACVLWADGARQLSEQTDDADRQPTAQVRPMYELVLNEDLPGSVRASALRGLAICATDRGVIRAVASALEDEASTMREMAARLVAEQVSGSIATQVFTTQLSRLPAATQVVLIQALGVRGDSTALPAVSAYLDAGDDAVRVAAIEATARLGDAGAAVLLVRRAANASDEESQYIHDQVAVMRVADLDETLVDSLPTVEPAVQAEVIEALARRNVAEAVPALLTMARSETEAVRAASVRGLRDLVRPRELPELADLLLQTSGTEQIEVRKAILAASRRLSAEVQGAAAVVGIYSSSEDEDLRILCLEMLGDLGVPAGLSVLEDVLYRDAGRGRYTAIVALSNWPTAAPMSDLYHVASTADLASHRVLALRGYIQLAGSAPDLTVVDRFARLQKVMELAGELPEKRRVLSVLAGVHLPDSLQFAMRHLSDPNLCSEAAVAATTIAQRLYPQEPQACAAALERVLVSAVPETAKEQAEKILTEIDASSGYLTDWEVAGPYSEEGKNHAALFDTRFEPEAGGERTAWRKIPVSTLDRHPAYVDLLDALDGGEQCVAYLRTRFDVAQSRVAVLDVFSDDGIKVWLNGALIHSNNVARPIMPEADRVECRLNKGVNHLLLKVTQNNLAWGAIVRMRPQRLRRPKLGEGFGLHVINAESRFEAAGILDVDKDGKLDILCGGFWYQAPTWTKRFVRDVPEEGDYHYDFANLPMDVDGDGWVDIVSAAWHNKKLFWVRNPGGQGGTWPVYDIDAPGNMETAMLVDINGDGRPDVLPNIMKDAAWYELKRARPGQLPARWTRHALPKEAAGHGLGAGDVNGDGQCDIVTPRGWLQQTFDTNDPWTWHAEWDLGHSSIPILVHDVDGDDDADILWGLGHDYGLFWLEQSGDPKAVRKWTQHLIDDEWSQPHFLLLADLNGDGRQELVTGKRYHAHNGKDPGGDDPVCVYFYEFDGKTRKWTRHLLHEGGRVGFGINTMAADIDGDGDVDIVAPGKSGLYLFENLLK